MKDFAAFLGLPLLSQQGFVKTKSSHAHASSNALSISRKFHRRLSRLPISATSMNDIANSAEQAVAKRCSKTLICTSLTSNTVAGQLDEVCTSHFV